MVVAYTAEATAVGGREGRIASEDGRLALELSTPVALGGAGGDGTNPEQLFAAGYAACFQAALLTAAGLRGGAPAPSDLAGATITARVTLAQDGGWGLTVALDLRADGLDRETAADLLARAHRRCPYSKAIAGNVAVTLSFMGMPVEPTV
jgi:Ohr subfamily peroxiredoxin